MLLLLMLLLLLLMGGGGEVGTQEREKTLITWQGILCDVCIYIAMVEYINLPLRSLLLFFSAVHLSSISW